MAWAKCRGCGFATWVPNADPVDPEECRRCKGKPLEWKQTVKAQAEGRKKKEKKGELI